MDTSTFSTLIVLPLLLAVAATILLSLLSFLVRYCSQDQRIVIIHSPTEVSVFGPGWVFLKPYRGKVLKLGIRPQECRILPWNSPSNEVLIRFEIVDAGKAVLAGIKQALFMIENADLAEREKEKQRLLVPYGPMNSFIRAFVRSLVAIAYGTVAREDPGLAGASLAQAGIVVRERVDRDFRDRGIALLSLTVQPRAAADASIQEVIE